MKKFFRLLVATMLLAVTATALCSCGIPSDSAKAKENLNKNKYTVSEEIATTAVKAACLVPYGISFYNNIETALWAVNSDGDNVLIVYCKDNDSATKVNDIVKTIYESINESAKENDSKADVKSGKSGKVVYIGTSAGVKAAG